MREVKLGAKLIRLPELESTSQLARELAEEGEPEGTVIAAEVQSGGVGRLGRSWASPKGGLWFSVILRPPVPVAEVPKLTLLAGVAVAVSVGSVYRIDARLKWPNDVMVDGKKLCGILSESRASGGRVDFAILGLGINTDFPLSALPPELRGTATTLRELLGRKTDPQALLRPILAELESGYGPFCGGDFTGILAEWKRLSDTLGRKVSVSTADGKVEGTAEDIDRAGALVVRTSGGPVAVACGDVVHLT